MSEVKAKTITASQLKSYLNSLEKEQEKEIVKRVHEYKVMCNANMLKIRKREITKIQKTVEKEYLIKNKVKDEILELLEECKEIPSNVEKLQIAEYMLYRVDINKAEKVVSKATKRFNKRYEEILNTIDQKIEEFPVLDDIEAIDYREFAPEGNNLAKSKEQYKLQYTEEERKALIQKELEMIEKAKEFNSIPIPHEILRNSDKDIQSKMQKFNAIRQKRIRILSTMQENYEKLLDPREILNMADEAIAYIENIEDILTKAEYNSIKNILNRRKKRVNRNTNEIRTIIETKEKKTGIENFNIQQARYVRMEYLRNVILEASNLIKENSVDGLAEQLEKLKISYEREKQFASVIQNLNGGRDGNTNAEVIAYEQQIHSLQYKLLNSKRIVEEEQEKIKNAKKELLVLWKMEINSAVCKKKENLGLPSPDKGEKPQRSMARNKNAFIKLKKVSRGKHASV